MEFQALVNDEKVLGPKKDVFLQHIAGRRHYEANLTPFGLSMNDRCLTSAQQVLRAFFNLFLARLPSEALWEGSRKGATSLIKVIPMPKQVLVHVFFLLTQRGGGKTPSYSDIAVFYDDLKMLHTQFHLPQAHVVKNGINCVTGYTFRIPNENASLFIQWNQKFPSAPNPATYLRALLSQAEAAALACKNENGVVSSTSSSSMSQAPQYPLLFKTESDGAGGFKFCGPNSCIGGGPSTPVRSVPSLRSSEDDLALGSDAGEVTGMVCGGCYACYNRRQLAQFCFGCERCEELRDLGDPSDHDDTAMMSRSESSLSQQTFGLQSRTSSMFDSTDLTQAGFESNDADLGGAGAAVPPLPSVSAIQQFFKMNDFTRLPQYLQQQGVVSIDDINSLDLTVDFQQVLSPNSGTSLRLKSEIRRFVELWPSVSKAKKNTLRLQDTAVTANILPASQQVPDPSSASEQSSDSTHDKDHVSVPKPHVNLSVDTSGVDGRVNEQLRQIQSQRQVLQQLQDQLNSEMLQFDARVKRFDDRRELASKQEQARKLASDQEHDEKAQHDDEKVQQADEKAQHCDESEMVQQADEKAQHSDEMVQQADEKAQHGDDSEMVQPVQHADEMQMVQHGDDSEMVQQADEMQMVQNGDEKAQHSDEMVQQADEKAQHGDDSEMMVQPVQHTDEMQMVQHGDDSEMVQQADEMQMVQNGDEKAQHGDDSEMVQQADEMQMVQHGDEKLPADSACDAKNPQAKTQARARKMTPSTPSTSKAPNNKLSKVTVVASKSKQSSVAAHWQPSTESVSSGKRKLVPSPSSVPKRARAHKQFSCFDDKHLLCQDFKDFFAVSPCHDTKGNIRNKIFERLPSGIRCELNDRKRDWYMTLQEGAKCACHVSFPCEDCKKFNRNDALVTVLKGFDIDEGVRGDVIDRLAYLLWPK